MSGPGWDHELAFALTLADAAAAVVLPASGGRVVATRKPDGSEVTEFDVAAEAAMRGMIAERFPADAVLGEEHGHSGPTGAERRWLLDPIDGTQNFVDGIQLWVTLVALVAGDRTVVAVVTAPGLGERYQAVAGGGAFLNGEPIHVSDRADLGDATLLHGPLEGWVEGPRAAGFARVTAAAGRTRGLSDGWGAMLVARGSAEVLLDRGFMPWDLAAPRLIVEEAGGRMTGLAEPFADGDPAVATNGLLHDRVLACFGAPDAPPRDR